MQVSFFGLFSIEGFFLAKYMSLLSKKSLFEVKAPPSVTLPSVDKHILLCRLFSTPTDKV